MYSELTHMSISGISACVPRDIDEIVAYPTFDKKNAKKFMRSTGIHRRRKADEKTCTSDLCLAAAEQLLDALHWTKDSISLLVFVSQTPDYRLPATSCILQDRLGLSKDCATVDISNGCSGWVYGLNVCTSMLSASEGKRALLLAGDTLLKICSPEDKSTWPLFGDAGTCTAIEFNDSKAAGMEFNLHSDGAGAEMIIVRGGGDKNPLLGYGFAA
jgi:3-oxoacyl-[acyl-carrier-protein] synthase-3